MIIITNIGPRAAVDREFVYIVGRAGGGRARWPPKASPKPPRVNLPLSTHLKKTNAFLRGKTPLGVARVFWGGQVLRGLGGFRTRQRRTKPSQSLPKSPQSLAKASQSLPKASPDYPKSSF